MRLAHKLDKNSVLDSTVDGSGFRLVIFTQGCNHGCTECHNKSAWNINNGYEYDVEYISSIISAKYKEYSGFYSGLTISGGDPLLQDKELLKLLKLLRDDIPDLNIWIYTGYETNEFFNDFNDIALLTDTVVTGKFIKELRDSSCKFKGSKNQEIIEVKDYLASFVL